MDHRCKENPILKNRVTWPEHLQSGKQEIAINSTTGHGQKGDVALPQRSGPQITEAANKSSAVPMTTPVEIALTVRDLSAASPEVEAVLKEFKAKTISYQSLEKENSTGLRLALGS